MPWRLVLSNGSPCERQLSGRVLGWVRVSLGVDQRHRCCVCRRYEGSCWSRAVSILLHGEQVGVRLGGMVAGGCDAGRVCVTHDASRLSLPDVVVLCGV